MKKLILTALSVLLYISSYSQSLTFTDVLHVFKNHDAAGYLKTKGFTRATKVTNMDYYAIKYGTKQEEKFIYDPRGISYGTFDTKYLRTLVDQIKKQFPQLYHDESSAYSCYQFGDATTNILLHINKKSGSFSTLSVGRK